MLSNLSRLIPLSAWLCCLGAILACNLTIPDDISDNNAAGDASGPPPTVEIASPFSEQQVYVGSDVDIHVVAYDAIGVDRVQLSVSDRVSSTKSFPEDTTTGEAILRWRPDRTGRFELSVRAYRGYEVYSEPAIIVLYAITTNEIMSNPAGGQTAPAASSSAACTARVLIGNLRRRTGPDTSYDYQGNFDLNEHLTVIGRNAATTWIQVQRLDNTQNWVINNGDWIELSGSCNSLSVTG